MKKILLFDFDDFMRESATSIFRGPTARLKLVRRCGGEEMYIGIPDNGAEIDRHEARELAIILNRFAKTGHFH